MYIYIHTYRHVCMYIYIWISILYMYIHVYMMYMSLPCSKKGIAFWEAYRKPSQKMTEEQICLRNGRGKEKESMRKGREKDRLKRKGKEKGNFLYRSNVGHIPTISPLLILIVDAERYISPLP